MQACTLQCLAWGRSARSLSLQWPHWPTLPHSVGAGWFTTTLNCVLCDCCCKFRLLPVLHSAFSAHSCPCCRPAYSQEEWAAALEETGNIACFEDIVDAVSERVCAQQSPACDSTSPAAVPEDCSMLPCRPSSLPVITSLQGIEPSIRPDVWPFLLELFEPCSTYLERREQHALLVRQYQQLLLQCQVRWNSVRSAHHLCWSVRVFCCTG